MIGDLIALAILLVIIGFVCWLVNKLVPMDATIKQIATVLICLVVLLMVLGVLFGKWHPPHIVGF